MRSEQISRVHAWFNMLDACDFTAMHALLIHGLPIDTRHPLRHTTALVEAVRLGNAKTVQWLIEQGAVPAQPCGSPKTTALHLALMLNHWTIAALLTRTREACCSCDAQGATPLHILCGQTMSTETVLKASQLASILISNGCPLDTADHDGASALHYCVANDSLELAVILLKYGANPNVQIKSSGVTPLHIAALENNMSMSQLLIEHGANHEVTTNGGSTAMALCPALRTLIPAMNTECARPLVTLGNSAS